MCSGRIYTMKTFMPWFASAVLFATLVAQCGSASVAANARSEESSASGEVHSLQIEVAALKEENARLRWQALSAAQESAGSDS
jgi:outer membrane murein-binding lipoprotein Lpp